LDTDLAEALNNLGLSYESLGLRTEATDAYRSALRIDPELSVAHYNLALLYDERGMRPQALKSYRNAVETDPTDVDAAVRLVALLIEASRASEAVPHARMSVAAAPGRVDVWKGLGSALAASGRVNESVDAFVEARTIAPDDPEVLMDLGTAYLASGDTKSAELQLRGVVKRWPELAQAHNNLGVALLRNRRHAAAISALQQAIALEGEFVAAVANLGDVYREMGLWEFACLNYEQALVLREDVAVVHRGMAACRAQQGKSGEAETHLQRALELEPGDAQALAGLAWLYTSGPGERPREAVTYARMAVELAPADRRVDYLTVLAEAQVNEGDAAGAVATLKRALAEDPASAHIQRRLSQLEGVKSSR